VVVLAGPLGEVAAAWRRRSVQVVAAVLGASVVAAALVFVTTPNTTLLPGPPVPEGGVSTKLEALVGQTEYYGRNMIAWFGWLDVSTPTFAYWVWMALVGFLVGLVALVGGRPAVRATALTVVGTLVLPVVAQWPSLDEIGMPWQGRYTLPVGVGIVVVAIVGIDEAARAGRVRTARLPVLLVVPAAAGHVVAFYWALRRYATGGDGPLWLVGEAVWSPPGGVVAVTALAVLAATACAVAALAPPRRPSATG
jgi:hypothetical protein